MDVQCFIACHSTLNFEPWSWREILLRDATRGFKPSSTVVQQKSINESTYSTEF